MAPRDDGGSPYLGTALTGLPGAAWSEIDAALERPLLASHEITAAQYAERKGVTLAQAGYRLNAAVTARKLKRRWVFFGKHWGWAYSPIDPGCESS